MPHRRPNSLTLALLALTPLAAPAAIAQDSGELARVFEGGNKWAVVIGAEAYIAVNKLQYCCDDARLLANTLVKHCGYPKDNILLVTDERAEAHLKPIRLNLQKQIPAWLKFANVNDTVLVYYSGHGVLDAAGNGYLAPLDTDPANIPGTCYPTSELRKALSACAAKRKILILDCCHAGGAKDVKPLGPSGEEIGSVFGTAAGLITLASCKKSELSQESDEFKQGVFTYFLAEGLRGAADRDRDGIVSSDELYQHVFERVPSLARRKLGAEQHPTRLIGEDVVGVFALAKVGAPAIVEPIEPGLTRARFLVREESDAGPPAVGAEIELFWKRDAAAAPQPLARAATDAQGQATLDLKLTLAQQAGGVYLASVSQGGKTYEARLSNFPAAANVKLVAPAKKTLEPTPPSAVSLGKSAGEEWSANGRKIKFHWCPPGAFTMGSPESDFERGPDEGPARVTLTRGFWLSAHETTQADWLAVMDSAPWKGKRNMKEGPRYPATHVAWKDAAGDDVETFLKKWNDQERKAGRLPAGWEYRLPTEAQWEYACRAGEQGAYCFGDDASKLHEYAWFSEYASAAGEDHAREVGLKKPNRWGLHDMHGNAWEWCQDVYQEKLAGGADPRIESASGAERVSRGGSWTNSARRCRAANRDGDPPDLRRTLLGFRMALVPVESN